MSTATSWILVEVTIQIYFSVFNIGSVPVVVKTPNSSSYMENVNKCLNFIIGDDPGYETEKNMVVEDAHALQHSITSKHDLLQISKNSKQCRNCSLFHHHCRFCQVKRIKSFLANSYLRSKRNTAKQLKYKIQEEVANGTEIGNLMNESGLRDMYPSGVIEQITFRFVAESVAFFSLDSKSGVITINSRIDRDSPSLCKEKKTCELQFSVVIKPLKYLEMMKIIIEVLDLNDNRPNFKESVFRLQINEAVSVATIYNLPVAYDWDSPVNGIQRYTLNPIMEQFDLNVNKKLDTTDEVTLIVKKRLDRETQAEYKFQLLAFDPEPDPGILEVIISVLDSNDNTPEFTRPYYETNIPENLTPGKTFLRINAVDPDLGPSGQVEYFFSPHSLSQHDRLFGINNSTGEIFLKNVLDRETTEVYQLVVVAQDRGPDSKGRETSLTIRVDDINDNDPRIIVNTLNGVDTHLASVVENLPQGTFVAHVRTLDPDAGDNGRVGCSLLKKEGHIYIANTNPFVLFQKQTDGEYQIVTTSLLDRERQSSYSVLLRCTDLSLTPRATEAHIQISVTDVNDNEPIFSMKKYETRMTENNAIGASVLRVLANDADYGENGRVTYEIPGNMTITFDIDRTGVIRALESVDREQVDTLKFPILAKDNGTPQKTGSALVVVVIEDFDDERPIFLQSIYTFNISENLPQGTTVGIVSALDRDGPSHNSFSYFIDNRMSSRFDKSAGAFYIDPYTGLISTREVLDREKVDHHRFTVTARDSKTGIMTGTTDVIVTVLDRQDNLPIIVFPHPRNDTLHIPAKLPAGSYVTRVDAYDLDATPEFNRIIYAMVVIGIYNPNEINRQFSDVDKLTSNIYLTNFSETVKPKNFLHVGKPLKEPDVFNIDSDLAIITSTEPLQKFSDKMFQILVIVRNPISKTDPTLSRVVANLFLVVNSSLEHPESFLASSESSLFNIQVGFGIFRSLSNLLLYLIVAVVSGCILVVASVILAIVILRKRERSRRLERMHKLNGSAALLDGNSTLDGFKVTRHKGIQQTEESLPLSSQICRDPVVKNKSLPEQVPFCDVNRKESTEETLPPWTVTLEGGVPSLHRHSSKPSDQIWMDRKFAYRRESDNSKTESFTNIEHSERFSSSQVKKLIPPPPPPTRGNFWKNQEHQTISKSSENSQSSSLHRTTHAQQHSNYPPPARIVSVSLPVQFCASNVSHLSTKPSSLTHTPPQFSSSFTQTLKSFSKVRSYNPAAQSMMIYNTNIATLRSNVQGQKPHNNHQCFCTTSQSSTQQQKKKNLLRSSSFTRPTTLRIDESLNVVHNFVSQEHEQVTSSHPHSGRPSGSQSSATSSTVGQFFAVTNERLAKSEKEVNNKSSQSSSESFNV